MIFLQAPRAEALFEITVAEAGERHNKTKTMKTDSNLSLANRKQLADMLDTGYQSLRDRVKNQLREKRDTLAKSLIRDFAKKKGALKIKAQVDLTRERLNEQERDLSQMGFYFDSDGDVRLTGSAGAALSKIVDDRLDKELGTLEAIDARFNSLQVAMMTVPTLEDAEKLFKSVSEI